MQLIVGILLLAAALVAFRLSLPKNGRPRWFVNTIWESPVVIAILLTAGVGVLFSIVGVAT